MGRTIDELIASAQKRFNLTDRFVKEITILIDLGYVIHVGGNIWNVHEYEVNQMTKTCTCPRDFPHDEKVGKMCPHVFAMTVMRLFDSENPKQRITLDDILRKDGIKEIRIEWNYDDNRRTVIGYVDRAGSTRLKVNERFDVDFIKMSSALERHGYRLTDIPHKQEHTFEYIYQYPISKTGKVLLSKSIWDTRSVTRAMIESKSRNDWAKKFEKEVAQ